MNNIVFFVNMKNNLKKMPTLVRFWEDFGDYRGFRLLDTPIRMH